MLATERWLALPAHEGRSGYSANTTEPDEIAKVKEQLLEAKPTLLALRRHHLRRQARERARP